MYGSECMMMVYDEGGVRAYLGNCVEVLRTLPDASMGSIITDPPYGLSDLPMQKVANALTAWLEGDREFTPEGYGFMGKRWDKFVPPPAAWDECLRVLKPGGYLLCFAGRRTMDLMGISIRLAGFEFRDSIGSPLLAWMYGQGFPKSTGQLKPAWEPIIVAHKPGESILNIDSARVEMSLADLRATTRSGDYGPTNPGLVGFSKTEMRTPINPGGRWPPNVVLSHVALHDPGTGEVVGDACTEGCVEGCPIADLDKQTNTSNGLSASRFFPCFRWEAKAAAAERPIVNGRAHSTVKPVPLIRWLVRLVTPPGGTVLDCFAGTGTTGQAARAEGFRSILIESDPLSIPFIRARLDAHPETEAAAAGSSVVEPEQDLFDLLNNA